jgi:hypothetical protein
MLNSFLGFRLGPFSFQSGESASDTCGAHTDGAREKLSKTATDVKMSIRTFRASK